MVGAETFDSLLVRWAKAGVETEKHRNLLGWLTGRLAKAQEKEARLYAQLISAAMERNYEYEHSRETSRTNGCPRQ